MIAEFRAVDPELPLEETLASMADLDVRSNFQPGGASNGTTGYFTVTCPDFETFHEHLETDTSVAEYTALRTRAGRRCYRIHFQREVRRLAPAVVEEGVLVERLRNAEGKWEFRVFAPDRETLVEVIDYCKDRCRSFTLTQLFTGEESDVADGMGLTTAQRETLCLAQREGFFEVPRLISQAELAEELDVSTSAVSQRIRKGLDVILEDALDPDWNETRDAFDPDSS
jgi:predicted DNA binding protein